MKSTVSLSDFRDAFVRMGRKDNFSYEGLEALFEHFEYLEDLTGQEIELDVIAICCDYTEYTDSEFLSEFGDRIDIDEEEEEEEAADRLMEALQEETTVLEVSNGNYIVECF